VKSGIRKKSKSLDVYRQLYNPKHAIRTTLKGADGLYSVPLYMMANFSEVISFESQTG